MSARRRVKLALLRVARALGLFALARRLTAGTVKVLGFHYVSLEDEGERFPSLFLGPEELRGRLDHLRGRYRVVSLDEAVSDLESGRKGRGRVVLTFDDGLYNFAAAAAPILEAYGMTATVYVVTGHVETGIPVCAMLLRDILRRSGATELSSPIPDLEGPHEIATPEGRARFEACVTERLSRLPHATPERLAFVSAVGRALDVDVEPILDRRIWDVLDADELRDLAARGFGVEAHGHHHLDVVEHGGEVLDEVTACRRLLEEVTGREVRHYCYPFGLWTRRAWPALEEAGMRSATTTLYGCNSPRTPRLSLRRFMDGGNQTRLEFEFELSGLRWLLWGLRHPSRRWRPDEKLVKYTESGRLY